MRCRFFIGSKPSYFLCAVLFHSWTIQSAFSEQHSEDIHGGGTRPGGHSQLSDLPGCPSHPGDIARVANGESQDVSSIVVYVSDPDCEATRSSLQKAALGEGVKFWNQVPLRLDRYAIQLKRGRAQFDSLAAEVPDLLRSTNLVKEELTPIVMQLALISPEAGRRGLAYLAQEEIIASPAATGKLGASFPKSAAERLAVSLYALGLAEAPIGMSFAKSTQDLAIQAQADSLGKVLRGLGRAAAVSKELMPALSNTATAVAKAMESAENTYTEKQREGLRESIFSSLLAFNSSDEFIGNDGDYQLQAFIAPMQALSASWAALVKGETLNDMPQRKLWRAILLLLGKWKELDALAETIALSLTERFVYLSQKDRVLLLRAAENHTSIAVALQDLLFREFVAEIGEGGRSLAALNNKSKLKKKTYVPWVDGILLFPKSTLSFVWLEQAVNHDFVSDGSLESHFPKFTLSARDHLGQSVGDAISAPTSADQVAAMAETLAATWRLHRVLLPPLSAWLSRQ